MSGIVYLVGAGPGDPKLITIGGANALKIADVVVYDRLAHPRLLEYAPVSAERIYVGKKADHHAMKQEDINAVLADRAAAGHTVVRLKGGDPFVFGRGGEEAEYLRDHGLAFVIIPGVTSAIAGPAYAGIPVTHRDAASSFAVITGHERDDAGEAAARAAGEAEGRRRWEKISYAADTLVFLMGVENLTEIVTQLTAHGRSTETPVALVRWATWAGRQRTLVGTLGTIVELVRQAGFQAPAVTVVGDVALLRDRLRWWDTGPLAGKRIIVTRAREQASEMVDMLLAANAEPIEFPLIKSAPPADRYAALDTAIASLGGFQWILFASATAVTSFFHRLRVARRDARALGSTLVGAVGAGTASALEENGITADFIPGEATGTALGAELPDVQNAAILFPRAAVGDTAMVEILSARGARVTIATAYETMIDAAGADAVRERLSEGSVDVITFTSSSTVRNFREALGSPPPPSVLIAAIGPNTAGTVTEVLGRDPDIVATDHTVNGLIEAIKDHYSAEPN